MSTDELVNAYIEGGVSRRTFIRRLVAAGVSVGAAASYAHLLAPGRASAQSVSPDFYAPPQLQLDVASQKVNALVKEGAIEVIVFVQKPAQIQLIATAIVPAPVKKASAAKRKRKRKVVANTVVDFPAAGQQLVKAPLNAAGRKLLRRARKAKLLVTATAIDRRGVAVSITDAQTLKRKKKRKRRR